MIGTVCQIPVTSVLSYANPQKPLTCLETVIRLIFPKKRGVTALLPPDSSLRFSVWRLAPGNH
ncbi:MAG: hypothetical protein ACI9G1_002174 [Pirellulaceae bacterium]|jgi:hypothetical protein